MTITRDCKKQGRRLTEAKYPKSNFVNPIGSELKSVSGSGFGFWVAKMSSNEKSFAGLDVLSLMSFIKADIIAFLEEKRTELPCTKRKN
jgi:hypothetical protein